MFLADPPSTQADLHFRLLGFSVRVHPFFWIMALLLGMGGGEAGPMRVLIWVAVVFVSILIHELGHAWAIRCYGGQARIVLYGFGGLAIEENTQRMPWQQIVISSAGPAAGFMLAAGVVAILAAAGHFVGFQASLLPVSFLLFDSISINLLIVYLLYINVFWGLINLLPIYPLDGGQIARELFTMQGNPRQGVILSLRLSMIVAAAVAFLALIVMQAFYMALFFGYMAYSSYRTLQAYTGHGRGGAW